MQMIRWNQEKQLLFVPDLSGAAVILKNFWSANDYDVQLILVKQIQKCHCATLGNVDGKVWCLASKTGNCMGKHRHDHQGGNADV